MRTTTVQKKISQPRYFTEAQQLLATITCGQPSHYHVRDAYSVVRKGTYEPQRDSFCKGFWLPARFLRKREEGEPHFPRYVEELRTLTSYGVANHLEGKGWVGVAPPSWVSWFAFDIDLPKVDEAGELLSDEAAAQRRDDVLASVWRAFDFGPDRLPVVLLTPGGGYHIYVPLTRADGSGHHTWPAHLIRDRVTARLQEAGLSLRDGQLELWPSGKVLRFPMGRRMALLEALNPSDPDYLGLRPVHAKWGERRLPGSTATTPTLRRDIGAGTRAFLAAFEAARKPLGTWLFEDEANWSSTYGPFGDSRPAQVAKNTSFTSKPTSVLQEYEEGAFSDGWLLRGEFFRKRISKLLRTGLTVPGGRHDAVLKLTYYFGIGQGLSEVQAMEALSQWLQEFEHVSNYRQRHGNRVFINQSLREARHYYRNHVLKVGALRGRRTISLGVPLGEDSSPFLGMFSGPAVEEAALAILRFAKGYADSEGMVREPVEFSSRLLSQLCGERRVRVETEDGSFRRVRASQRAVEELTEMGVFTLYKQYRVNHHGRFFCCWYQFGSGILPGSDELGTTEEETVLATACINEGQLRLVSLRKRLGRLVVRLIPEETPLPLQTRPPIPSWVERMYERHNFAPGDLCVDLNEHLGGFRDVPKTDKLSVEEGVEREFGTVIAFADDSGYGFIEPDAGGPDLFVHQTHIVMRGFRTLRVGDRVELTRSDSAKGPRALWVRPMEEKLRGPVNDNLARNQRREDVQP